MYNRKECYIMDLRLPLATSDITGLQFHSYFLSVILNSKKNYNFVYNNYIQLLVRYKNHSHVDFMFESLLSSGDLPIHKINIKGIVDNIKDLIINTLTKGFYLVINVNECYLPHRRAYNSYYRRHDIMIYGINTERNTCYTCGYDEFGHYSEIEHNISDIETAYYHLESDWDFEHCIFKMDESVQYNLDLEKINRDIIEYLYHTNSYNKLIDDFYINGSIKEHILNISSINCYGIMVYDFLCDEINNHLKKASSIDLRSYQLLYEHKCIIMKLITTLNSEGHIQYNPKNYTMIVNLAQQIKIMLLKYLSTANTQICNNILARLVELKEREKKELTNVQKLLSNNINNM